MSLITVNVKVVGGVKPTRPVTALEVANAVAPYIGKEFNVTIQSTQNPQQLADVVDGLLGVSPNTTFEETFIEVGSDTPLDKSKTLEECGIADGDKVWYRFYIAL
jgi:hypothetical protein